MDFQKRNITTTMFAITAFVYKGTKQVDTTYNVPIMSKITFTFTEIVLTTLISVFTEMSCFFFCLTQ
jgi:hypothetical protein